jgi:hypothetical protein
MAAALKHLVVRWTYQLTALGADAIGSVTWGLERLDDTRTIILDDPVCGRLTAYGGVPHRLFI